MREILAYAHFLPTAAGGLRRDFHSGLRIPVDFGLLDEDGLRRHYDCWIELVDREQVAPGEDCSIILKPFPESLAGKVIVGIPFGLREGRVIATGIITAIRKSN